MTRTAFGRFFTFEEVHPHMRILLTMIGATARGMLDQWYWKALAALVIFLFGGDGTIHHLYQALGVLMLLDLMTGVWKARKSKELSSKIGVAATCGKFGVYAIVVISARMLEEVAMAALGIPTLGSTLVKVAIVYLATQEAVSIDENLRAINGVGLGVILQKFKSLLNGKTP